MTEVELKQCLLQRCLIKNSLFQKFKLGDQNVRRKWDLKQLDFSESDLTESIFLNCDLTEASFVQARLEGTCFEKCNLTKANFTQAHLERTSFADSKIDRTIMDVEGLIRFGLSKGFVLSES